MHASLATRTVYVPTMEIKLSRSGALLAAAEPRYDTLSAYVAQFAAPLSQLPSLGLFSFADPVFPELVLLVQAEAMAICGRCQRSPSDCVCPF